MPRKLDKKVSVQRSYNVKEITTNQLLESNSPTPMTTLNQWLEGKKKDEKYGMDVAGFKGTIAARSHNRSYNKALADFEGVLPTLLSTMEAEIKERIGAHEDNPHIENTLVTGINHDNSLVKHGANNERSRVLDIIHEYFKTQV